MQLHPSFTHGANDMNAQPFTRQQYLAQSREPWAHRRYYAQLVNNRTIAQVVAHIGVTRLLASADPHYNDIPLADWDRLCGYEMINYGYARGDMTQTRPPVFPLAASFESLGDYPTQAGLVCVAKEAARQYVERVREAEKLILETE